MRKLGLSSVSACARIQILVETAMVDEVPLLADAVPHRESTS